MKLFVDDLTHVDFSYIHSERGLLGETWSVRLELDGTLNDEGMICDFGIVKKRVKTWFDEGMDHSLVIATGLKNLDIRTEEARTEIHWRYPNGETFFCSGPSQAFELIDLPEICPEQVARWCESRVQQLFPEQVQGLKITLEPQAIAGPFYHYSHGLHQHQGNCQRIAHGHRSEIRLWLDERRSAEQEQVWAKRFKDIYIGTRSHLKSTHQGRYRFAYDAPQGYFELELPQRACYLIDTESTVEQIGQHIAQRTAEEHPECSVRVCAYEGIGKGSIAEVRAR